MTGALCHNLNAKGWLLDAGCKFIEAGAHYVIDTLAELDRVVSQIEVRLGSGEHP